MFFDKFVDFDGGLVHVSSEVMYMITNETTLVKANTLSQHHMGKFSQDKAFYEQVRSDFLKQSERYLRDSVHRSAASRFGAL